MYYEIHRLKIHIITYSVYLINYSGQVINRIYKYDIKALHVFIQKSSSH